MALICSGLRAGSKETFVSSRSLFACFSFFFFFGDFAGEVPASPSPSLRFFFFFFFLRGERGVREEQNWKELVLTGGAHFSFFLPSLRS
jgi:hypothetical protein